jgi:hypothetical protein
VSLQAANRASRGANQQEYNRLAAKNSTARLEIEEMNDFFRKL